MKGSVIISIHMAYWACYGILLFYIFHLLSLSLEQGVDASAYFLKLAGGFAILPALLSFYLAYAFYFARFLNRKKIPALCLALLVSAYLCTSLGGLLLKLLIGANLLFDEGPLIAVPLTLLMSVIPLIHGIFGIGMKAFISWYADIRLKEELNKKNYEVELALVKSQINPHFLFNTINNIDTLIEMDAARASQYLNKLSDIMRFMLYETKTEKIPLIKELEYIEKYIALQKIRTAHSRYVSFSSTGDPASWSIEPMLFIPFIENAFKHAEQVQEQDAIGIHFEFTENKIIFICENKHLPAAQNSAGPGGLGNDLIRKRLHLLFGSSHTLEIINKNAIYTVKLILEHGPELRHR